MNIGQAAQHTDLPVKTLRYYEEIGLVSPGRAANGYREYSPRQVEQLRFLGRARRLGFGIEKCRDLLALYQDDGRASSDVRALTMEHLAAIDEKITELQAIRATLEKLVRNCHNDERPDCPILKGIEGESRL